MLGSQGEGRSLCRGKESKTSWASTSGKARSPPDTGAACGKVQRQRHSTDGFSENLDCLWGMRWEEGLEGKAGASTGDV